MLRLAEARKRGQMARTAVAGLGPVFGVVQ
jgi:hypothetical protein